MKTKHLSFLIAFFSIVTNMLFAQQPDLRQPLPVDPAVKIGTLENGLTYYVQYNKMPEKRVEMRLVVNAGSILEDDDQQGLAHFVEHMCFNGTHRFSKSALVDFLEKSGVRFGADLNAYTSFDETVYMLQLPTDRQGLIDSAFMVLEEWAHAVSHEDEEIDKERGVIREEWRLGLGADDRMRKKYFPIIFNDSRYAERLPIGQIGVIDTASYETLRRFYRDWYRPNLQAIIVVGDLDTDMAEKKIIEHFSHIQNPENAPERLKYTIPGNKQPLVAIATDKEATSNMLMIFYKHEKNPIENLGDYKESLKRSLYNSMLNARLSEYNQQPNSPFIFASTYYGGFLGRSMDAYISNARVKENRIEDAIETLVKENEKVLRFGFNASELERQKTQILTRLEKQEKEKDKTNSSNYVRSYTSHFLDNQPIPGIENELELTRQLLPMIGLEEVNNLAAKWITPENLVVVVTAPDKEGVNVPDKETILNTIASARLAKVDPYIDQVSSEQLVSKKLKGSKIISEKKIEKLGVTEITLENGVTVVLKPTDYKNDEILLTAFGSGGSSIFSDEDAYAASVVSRAVGASGIGKFSSIELSKYLTGKVVSVQPFVEEVRQGFRGNASPKDLETMLQMIYAYFEGARRDKEAFEAMKSQMLNQFRFMKSNPQTVFVERLRQLATQNSPRTVVIPSEEQINSLNADSVYDMFDKLFETANEFTFILVGNFDPETIKPLLTTYLGSLPTDKPAIQWRNVSPKFPEGITDENIKKGTEYKSMVAIMMENEFEWNQRNRTELALLMRAFSIKLRENLREEMGGVYGVGAYQNNQQYPDPKYNIVINWGTNPDLVDTLSKIVFYEIDKLIDNGPTAEDMVKIKELSIRERETNDKQNNFWSSSLDFAMFNMVELLTFDEYRELINSVSTEDLKKAANRYFTPDHYLRLVLLPEE
jgi:zinc protease